MKSKDLLIAGSMLAVAAYVSTGAFYGKARREIKERANHVSELTKISDRPIELSHFNHSREVPYYNNPRNGLAVTDLEHYCYHLWWSDDPESIGMSYEGNRWALGKIQDRIFDFNRFSRLPLQKNWFKDQIQEGLALWDNFFDDNPNIYNALTV